MHSSAPEGDYSWSCGAGALIDGPVGLMAGLHSSVISLWGKRRQQEQATQSDRNRTRQEMHTSNSDPKNDKYRRILHDQ
jgi:hypothetical protein